MIPNARSRIALIVVDMSVEQVSDISFNRQSMIDNIRRLVHVAGGGSSDASRSDNSGFDLIVDSRLWLTDPSESSLSLVWEGTAKTLFVAGSEGASLIPSLRDLPMTFVKKYNYSCFAGDRCQLLSLLRSTNITHVAIAGINTDYCVFATALDAFQNNFRLAVITDAVSSVRGKAAHEEGLRNVERHFGPQALLATDQVMDRLQNNRHECW